MRIKISDPADRITRLVNMAEYFLAAYTTPYIVIEKYLPILINDYRELYLEIIRNEHETPFQELPEIFIFDVFQTIINSAYSYEYFIKGLDGAIFRTPDLTGNSIDTVFWENVLLCSVNMLIYRPFVLCVKKISVTLNFLLVI